MYSQSLEILQNDELKSGFCSDFIIWYEFLNLKIDNFEVEFDLSQS